MHACTKTGEFYFCDLFPPAKVLNDRVQQIAMITVGDKSQRPSWPSRGHIILDTALLEILVQLGTVAMNVHVGITCDGSQHRLEEFAG